MDDVENSMIDVARIEMLYSPEDTANEYIRPLNDIVESLRGLDYKINNCNNTYISSKTLSEGVFGHKHSADVTILHVTPPYRIPAIRSIGEELWCAMANVCEYGVTDIEKGYADLIVFAYNDNEDIYEGSLGNATLTSNSTFAELKLNAGENALNVTLAVDPYKATSSEEEMMMTVIELASDKGCEIEFLDETFENYVKEKMK